MRDVDCKRLSLSSQPGVLGEADDEIEEIEYCCDILAQ